MKPLRRLEVAADGTFARLQRGLRDCSLDEKTLAALQKERPELVIVDGDHVVVAGPRAGEYRLHYAFSGRDALVREFPALLKRLLPALDQADAPLGIRFRLADAPARPYVEPVLRANAFDLSREWLEMSLDALPGGKAGDRLGAGFTLRPATPDDADAIAGLDAAAFPAQLLTSQTAHRLSKTAPVLRVIEDSSAVTAIGFLHLDVRGQTGHIGTVALHPEYQRRGLGRAAMRWALAWFREQGLARASLTVSTDNAPAIALYRSLGFEVTRSGLDYRRPIDEEEARQAIQRQGRPHIRVRRR